MRNTAVTVESNKDCPKCPSQPTPPVSAPQQPVPNVFQHQQERPVVPPIRQPGLSAFAPQQTVEGFLTSFPQQPTPNPPAPRYSQPFPNNPTSQYPLPTSNPPYAPTGRKIGPTSTSSRAGNPTQYFSPYGPTGPSMGPASTSGRAGNPTPNAPSTATGLNVGSQSSSGQAGNPTPQILEGVDVRMLDGMVNSAGTPYTSWDDIGEDT
ncbi:hypothetical protein CC80DRAFT_504922 [Byssothecium circinans]|uniref:Uncharacterized protein n=1 Tax=Byssothecium circinans TaxID=147558 RepID=A0A6A5TXB6_9PLEO|nr:hypothetical protein CC80DRAFT_504922 [Byssothecium circinans]